MQKLSLGEAAFQKKVSDKFKFLNAKDSNRSFI
jgi:hypothetical protein